MSLSVTFPVDFIRALSQATTPEEVVGICAAQMPAILDVDLIGIMQTDGDNLVVTAISDEVAVSPGLQIDVRNSLTARVIKSRKSLIVRAPDAMGSAIVEKHFREGYKTVLVAPMIANGMLLGSFNAVSYREDAFRDADVERIVAVGHWIGSQLLIRKFASEMERLAMVDPMTDQANRRAFMQFADEQMTAFRDCGAGFALVLIDIDHFKRVNDLFGHEAGDLVLKESAGLISNLLDERDLLGRIGGEEFALILPGKSLSDAMARAEACRAALAANDLVVGRHLIRISASFGCARVQSGDSEIDDVLRRADRALYQAKAAGRNRVHQAA